MAENYPPYNYFICPECDKNKKIPACDFADHVKNVHGITDQSGERTMMMHVNKKPRHAMSFMWEIGGKIFYQYTG